MVLPAPEAPTMAMVSPGLALKLRPLKRGSSLSSYLKPTLSNSTKPLISGLSLFLSLPSISLLSMISEMDVTDSSPLVTTGTRPTIPAIQPTTVPKYDWYIATSPMLIFLLRAIKAVNIRQNTLNT